MTNSPQDTTAVAIPENPLDEITTFMRRFVVFNEPDHADVLALWILHTWAFDSAYATPYLYVSSPEKQSGKTRVMEVTQLLARNPVSTGSGSVAAMFRLIEDQSPALFIDEVDTVFSGAANEELRGVLNMGYKSGGKVTRFDGKDVVSFNVFCPKMLVGIDNGQMPDTLRDRCIPITLKRKKTTEEVERFMPRRVEPEAEILKARIEAWATHNFDRIMTMPDPPVLDGISDRAFEICEPLLIVARAVSKEASDSARQVLQRLLSDQTDILSRGVICLTAAKELFAEGKADKLTSAALAAHLGMTTKKLGVELKRYGIESETLRFRTGDKLKGYRKDKFADAWDRYL